jgi:nitrite reductase/ring-hydroxylating ferredoxin subunit
MDGFTKIGALGELKDRRPHNAVIGGMNVVVVKVGDDLFAFENNCPHQHFALLHQGTIEGCEVTCPMHGWTFDMKSGQSTNGNGRLRKLNIRILDGWVWVENLKPIQVFSLFE